jgi:hypothetical protein
MSAAPSLGKIAYSCSLRRKTNMIPRFCGETDDFCMKGCQDGYGGCGDVNRPSCGGSSVGKRTIGYYESWANTRKCQSVSSNQYL